VEATDDDAIEAKARQLNPGTSALTEQHLVDAEKKLVREAVKPFYDPPCAICFCKSNRPMSKRSIL
jgi:hypothetical protein